MDSISVVFTIPNPCPKVNPSVSKISLPLQYAVNPFSVPAHTGGADLSFCLSVAVLIYPVPAHTGGADLSKMMWMKFITHVRPRPHGRGGFK